MDIDKNNIKWSEQLENYFKEIGEKCQCYYVLHKKSEQLFSKRTTLIDLPVIVLSTVAGTLSIGNSSIFGYSSKSNIYIGCLSLFVGVLNTISTYFSWSKRCENHRIVSIQYSKLYRFISVELKLPIEERMKPNDMLKIIRETYERLQELSPLIPINIINDFKIKYKNHNIFKPEETNGLHNIEIYKNIEKEDEEKGDNNV
jgi:hypothetical protein